MSSSPQTTESQIGSLIPPYKGLVEDNLRELSNLRGNLISSTGGALARSLLVTSSLPGEGKSTAACSLAHTMALQGGARTLLVDGNFMNPILHAAFGVPQGPGLADLARDPESFICPPCYPTTHDNLWVMTIGDNVGKGFELYESHPFDQVIKRLAEEYDYVILDAPAVLTASEVSLIAPMFDGVLLVVRCEATRWEVVNTATDKLHRVGSKVLGAVLNRRKFYIPRRFYGKI